MERFRDCPRRSLRYCRAYLLFQFASDFGHTRQRAFFICVAGYYPQILARWRLRRAAHTDSADDFVSCLDRYSAGKRNGAFYRECRWWQGGPILGLFARGPLVGERGICLAPAQINRMRTGLIVTNEYFREPAAIHHGYAHVRAIGAALLKGSLGDRQRQVYWQSFLADKFLREDAGRA